MYKAILIFLAGGLGTLCRYGIQQIWPTQKLTSLLLINILGSFIIGLLACIKKEDSDLLYTILATGWCGGFTTFSAFSLLNKELINQNNYLDLFINIAASIVLGILACFFGIYCSKKIFG